MKFYTTRSLECTPEGRDVGYLIQLDQDTDFIYSFSPPGGDYQLAYHEANRGNFACDIASDGSLCTVPPPVPPAPTPPTFDQTTIETSNGSKLLIAYDSQTSLVNLYARVTSDSFLALGFGSSMF